MESKKRKVCDTPYQSSENRYINKLVVDVSQLKENVCDLKKIIKMLTVQIKYQNNKMDSLEESIKSKDFSSDITELSDLLRNQTIDMETETENNKEENISYYA
jgi:hypothetical protein